DEHEAQVAEPALARRDVQDIGRELAEPEPDRDRVLDALKRLSRRAAEVTAIVDVSGRIRDLLPGHPRVTTQLNVPGHHRDPARTYDPRISCPLSTSTSLRREVKVEGGGG